MTMAPHGSAKSSTGGTKPGEHEPVDFLATGFKVKTNCAFSVKILENFKLRSDHLASGSAPAPPRLARPPLLRILLSCCPRPQPVYAHPNHVHLPLQHNKPAIGPASVHGNGTGTRAGHRVPVHATVYLRITRGSGAHRGSLEGACLPDGRASPGRRSQALVAAESLRCGASVR